jgi:hypothetical protein
MKSIKSGDRLRSRYFQTGFKNDFDGKRSGPGELSKKHEIFSLTGGRQDISPGCQVEVVSDSDKPEKIFRWRAAKTAGSSSCGRAKPKQAKSPGAENHR